MKNYQSTENKDKNTTPCHEARMMRGCKKFESGAEIREDIAIRPSLKKRSETISGAPMPRSAAATTTPSSPLSSCATLQSATVDDPRLCSQGSDFPRTPSGVATSVAPLIHPQRAGEPEEEASNPRLVLASQRASRELRAELERCAWCID